MKIKHINTDTGWEQYDISGQAMKLCQIYLPMKLAKNLQIVAIYNNTNWLNRELNNLVEKEFLPIIEKYVEEQFVKHKLKIHKIKKNLEENKEIIREGIVV